MAHFQCRGVNDAFTDLVTCIHDGTLNIERSTSRNGDVLYFKEPVIITYSHPRERVLFNTARDANPFFHLYESLWMLAGRNDVAPLDYYCGNYGKITSDDGVTANGAYGHRWRNAYGGRKQFEGMVVVDQLSILIEHLRALPDSRRAVLQMWNVQDDLLKIGGGKLFSGDKSPFHSTGSYETDVVTTNKGSKDVCCNLSVLFAVSGSETVRPNTHPKRLDMTVFNRSNDLCLAWDTKFRSPEGDTNIQELARRFQNKKGFKFPVYTIDTVTGDQRLSWMTNAWKTGIKPVFKIGFDDGTYIRVTGDHVLFKKTKVFEGKRCVGLSIEERQACELKVGDRVIAALSNTSQARSGKYLEFKKNIFKNTSFDNLGDEHRAYWEFITGEKLGDEDVHHKDENGRNNKFDNLEKLTRSQHRSLHLLKNNPNYKMTQEQIFERASKGGKTHKGRKHSKQARANMSAGAKARDQLGNRERDGLGRYASNHKITSIEPCGVTAVFDFTVPGRHNAVLKNGVLVHNCWGALGANVVHFSMLQEYMADCLGVQVGVYHQVSNNLHVYLNNWEPDKWLGAVMDINNKYPAAGRVNRLVVNKEVFDNEVVAFADVYHGREDEASPLGRTFKDCAFREPFLEHVAKPMCLAFAAHKARNYDKALYYLDQVQSPDWKLAGTSWIKKRLEKYRTKQKSVVWIKGGPKPDLPIDLVNPVPPIEHEDVTEEFRQAMDGLNEG